MKKFISTFLLLVIIIGLIIGLVYTGKSIVKKNTEIAKLNQEIVDLKATVSTLNNTIEKLQDGSKNSQVPEQIDEKEEKEIIETGKAVFSVDKITNKQEGTTITQDISDSNNILSINVDTQTNSLVININRELAKLMYGYTGDGQTHTVAGFSQNIADACLAIVGNTTKDLKVVLLMDDGSIKYIDIENILDGSYNVKTIAEEKDYVKLVKVSIKNEDTTRYGIVGIKNNGVNTVISFN